MFEDDVPFPKVGYVSSLDNNDNPSMFTFPFPTFLAKNVIFNPLRALQVAFQSRWPSGEMPAVPERNGGTSLDFLIYNGVLYIAGG